MWLASVLAIDVAVRNTDESASASLRTPKPLVTEPVAAQPAPLVHEDIVHQLMAQDIDEVLSDHGARTSRPRASAGHIHVTAAGKTASAEPQVENRAESGLEVYEVHSSAAVSKVHAAKRHELALDEVCTEDKAKRADETIEQLIKRLSDCHGLAIMLDEATEDRADRKGLCDQNICHFGPYIRSCVCNVEEGGSEEEACRQCRERQKLPLYLSDIAKLANAAMGKDPATNQKVGMGHSHLTGIYLGDANVFGTLSELKVFKGLKFLELKRNPEVSGNLVDLKTMTDLQYLTLYETQVQGDLGDLSKHHALRHLNLGKTQVGGGLEELQSSPTGDSMATLVTIMLASTQVKGKIRALTQFRQLTTLILSDTKIESGEKEVEGLASKELKVLYLAGTQTQVNIDELVRHAQLRRVRVSELTFGSLDDHNLEGLTELREFSAQDALRITGNIANFNCPKLEELELARTGVVGLVDQLPLNRMPNLQRLDLSNTRVAGDLTQALFPPKMRQIALSRCKVTGSIANFKQLRELQSVDLSDCSELVGDVLAFQAAPIEELDVQNTKIGGNIMAFNKASKLRRLNVANTLVEGEVSALSGLEALQDLDLTCRAPVTDDSQLAVAASGISGDVKSLPFGKLVTLAIDNCINLRGEITLETARTAKHLKFLDLSRTNVELKFLQEGATEQDDIFPQLISLVVKGVPIARDALEVLTVFRNNPFLSHIVLSDCALTGEVTGRFLEEEQGGGALFGALRSVTDRTSEDIVNQLQRGDYREPKGSQMEYLPLGKTLQTLDLSLNQITAVVFTPPASLKKLFLRNNAELATFASAFFGARDLYIDLRDTRVRRDKDHKSPPPDSSMPYESPWEKAEFQCRQPERTGAKILVSPHEYDPETLCRCKAGYISTCVDGEYVCQHETERGRECGVPFQDSKGKWHYECSNTMHNEDRKADRPWCATEPGYVQDRKWDYCKCIRQACKPGIECSECPADTEWRSDAVTSFHPVCRKCKAGYFALKGSTSCSRMWGEVLKILFISLGSTVILVYVGFLTIRQYIVGARIQLEFSKANDPNRVAQFSLSRYEDVFMSPRQVPEINVAEPALAAIVEAYQAGYRLPLGKFWQPFPLAEIALIVLLAHDVQVEYLKHAPWSEQDLKKVSSSTLADLFHKQYTSVHDIVREQEGYASIGTSAAALAEAAGACAAPNKLDTHSPQFLEQINASFIKEGVAHPEWLVVWDKARKVDDHRRPRAPPSAESVALILMTYEAAKDCYFAFKRMMHEVVKEVNDHDQSGDASLVEANIAPIKALPRVIEKAVLRPHSGAAWDMIRSQIVCNNCQQIAAVLTRLEERHHKNVDIKVCQVNDRFKNPAAGWADVSLYLSFPKLSDLVCEVQVVHNNLLVAREELGAHDQYADTRFASELLRIKEQIRKEAASESAPSTDATRSLTRKEPGAPR